MRGIGQGARANWVVGRVEVGDGEGGNGRRRNPACRNSVAKVMRCFLFEKSCASFLQHYHPPRGHLHSNAKRHLTIPQVVQPSSTSCEASSPSNIGSSLQDVHDPTALPW